MSDKRPEWSDFIPTADGVRDVAKGWTFKRGMDGRLEGNLPFDAGVELDAEFVERLQMAQRVDEAYLRSEGGGELSMNEY
jgi:hypothetical protein